MQVHLMTFGLDKPSGLGAVPIYGKDAEIGISSIFALCKCEKTPRILFLDESTGAIDTRLESKRYLWRVKITRHLVRFYFA